MNNPKLLIFDSNWLCYRSRYSLPNLSNDDQPTAIIFNFINEIIKHCSKFSTNKICFAFDSRKSLRKDIYKLYKYKRKEDKTDEDKYFDDIMFNQINLLKDKILPQLGFKNIWHEEGFESDDTIASFCLNNSDKYDIIVVASDKDIYQLLDHCSLYNFKNGNWKLYTKENLFKEYGTTPEQWLEGKFLWGCSSDSIPGITGVKEKTACKYILSNMNEKIKTYKKIKHRENFYIDRNKPLIKLPFKNTKKFGYIEDVVLNILNFIEICKEYQFISYLSGNVYDKWLEIFCDGEEKTLGIRI